MFSFVSVLEIFGSVPGFLISLRFSFVLHKKRYCIIFVLSGPLLSLLFCSICLALNEFNSCMFSAATAS